VNNAMDDNYKTLLADGVAYGKNGGNDIEILQKFSDRREELVKFAKENLGEITGGETIKNYDANSMKVFLSGIAQENPAKALKMIDNEQVASHFNNPEEFLKFKEAIETKALNMQENAAKNEILNRMKSENSLLSQNRSLSSAELQQATQGMSPHAQALFYRMNGFTKSEMRGGGIGGGIGNNEKPVKLSNAEKTQMALDIHKSVMNLSSQTDLQPQERLDDLHNRIYQAMNAGAISRDEGVGYINQIVSPHIEKMQKDLSQYDEGFFARKIPFVDNYGYSAIESYYNDPNNGLKITEVASGAGKAKKNAKAQQLNNENHLELLNTYRDELAVIAGQKNIKISDIPSLPTSDQNFILKEATNNTIKAIKERRHPELMGLPDLPNQILTDSNVENIVAGSRKLTPDATIPVQFETYKLKDGTIAYKYPDGRIVRRGY
jgi:hypothetical protein